MIQITLFLDIAKNKNTSSPIMWKWKQKRVEKKQLIIMFYGCSKNLWKIFLSQQHSSKTYHTCKNHINHKIKTFIKV